MDRLPVDEAQTEYMVTRQPEGRELCGGSRLSLAHSRFFRMLLISERLSCDSVHFF